MIEAVALDDVHRLTSGQVITDVVSVVKELVENALDACSTQVEVVFSEQGLVAVEVTDNGDGIAEVDFQNVCARHATSKLHSFDDLLKTATLGFRGEALSSLCATADVTITTNTNSAIPRGHLLKFGKNGDLISTTPVTATKGTTVCVSDLFGRLPVRRKDLERNIKREYTKTVALLTNYAIFYPTTRFTVYNLTEKKSGPRPGSSKRSLVLGTQGGLKGTLHKNMISIFGSSGARGLVPVSLNTGDLGERFKKNFGDPPLEVTFEGLISDCSFGLGRSAADRQFYYINGRPVLTKLISKTVNEVFRSFNNVQYPVVILNVKIDPNHVDINVTPDKRTVLIHNEELICEVLHEMLTQFYDDRGNTIPRAKRQQTLDTRAYDEMDHNDHTYIKTEPNLKEGLFVKNEEHMSSEDNSFEYEEDEHIESVDANIVDLGNTDRREDIRDDEESDPEEHSCSEEDVLQPKAFTEKSNSSAASDLTTEVREMEIHPRKTFESPLKYNAVINCRRKDKQTITSPVSELFPESSRTQQVQSLPQQNIVSSDTELLNFEITEYLQIDEDNQNETNYTYQTSPVLGYKVPAGSSPIITFFTTETQVDASLDAVSFSSSKRRKTHLAEAHNDFNEDHTDGMEEEDGNEEKDQKERVSNHTTNNEEFDIERESESNDEEDDTEDMCVKDVLEEVEHDREVNRKDRYSENEPQEAQSLQKNKLKPLFKLKARMSYSREEISKLENQLITTYNDKRSTFLDDKKVSEIEDGDEAERMLSLSISKADFLEMQVVGQFNLGFILVTKTVSVNSKSFSNLFIVDQHASDEKFNFERLQRNTLFQSQPLVVPQKVELSAIDELAVIDNRHVFELNGFKLKYDEDEVPGQRILLTAFPMLKRSVFGLEDFQELLHLLQKSGMSTESLQVPVIRCLKVRNILALRACRSSIMIGQHLNKETMKTVVHNLGLLNKPWNCPHGRPTMRHLLELKDWQLFDADYRLN